MIINIKMKNGADLIGHAEHIENVKHVQEIQNPLRIVVTENGLSLTMYAAFAKDGIITIPRSDFVYVAEASEVAVEKYEQVLSNIDGDYDEEDEEHNENGMYSTTSTKYVH